MNARSLFLLTALSLPLTASAQRQTPDHQRSISITATAKVTNLADTAAVHIGFLLYGPDKDAAYATGSRASNAIIEALKKAGIPGDAIESQSQNLSASQPYELEKLSNSEKAAHAFKIEQQWTVRTAAADAPRLLDLAIKSGANASGNIDWSLHDPNVAETAAATKAIQRAREQAAAMAAGLSVRLGQLLNATNTVEAEPIRPLPMMARSFDMQAKSAPEPLAINPRQIETTATVTAVFAIE
jgi:uncharacterized protein YggE